MNEVMQSMNNLENGLQIKNMTAVEAAQALKMLATMIKGPVALGLWEGSLTGKISGHTHDGEMIAVFSDTALVAPFGFRGDQEGEACAALFATAFSYADKIVDALEQAEARAVEVERQRGKLALFLANEDCPYLAIDEDGFCQTYRWCKAHDTEEDGFDCEVKDVLDCWLKWAAQKDGDV